MAPSRSHAKKPTSGAARPYAGKRRDDGARPPRRDFGDSPRPRFNREDRPARRPSRNRARIFFRAAGPRRRESARYTPRGDRPQGNREDRGPCAEKRPYARPASCFAGPRNSASGSPYAARQGSGDEATLRPRASRTRESRRQDGLYGRGQIALMARSGRIPREMVTGPSEKFGGDEEVFAKTAHRTRGDRTGVSARPSRDGDAGLVVIGGEAKPFGGDKKFSRSRGAPDRSPRKDFGSRPDRPRGVRQTAADSQALRKKFGSDRGDERPRVSRPRERSSLWRPSVPGAAEIRSSARRPR